LRGLIVNGLKRLNGQGGHPVIELQTNFGGGKTHSMLALYHLVSGMAPGKLSGIDVLMNEEEVSDPPAGTKRAVLVGTAISPGQAEKTGDGLTLNTLWGRLAYQLGGKDAYQLIAESDTHGTSPGSDDLVKLFKHVGPCLILIDEWVAFCRQTYETHGLPGGSFDQNLTFAQALTEAVKASPQALLVASLPQSQIEVGGTGGKEALASLEDTFARLEFNWRPANQEESYEIVRRRLFEPITDPQLYADRDAAISQFFNLYAKHRNEFPSEVSEGSYEDRMRSAYPVHPELFDRLYKDWSSLEEFQRTRGVLRLMATVIHVLWARQDKSLMIMPGLLPMDDPNTVTELTRYLPENWVVIMGSDVDGTGSLPARLDTESSRFGQYWATRRVSRTVYMGSAPVDGQSNRGLDIRRVRLGCVQPGENVAVFGDALRQLGDHASHLYADSSRYWYATQPNVLTMARDRAGRIQNTDREEEVNRFLRDETTERKGFHRVHVAPSESGDVPDDPETRLVIFSADKCHSTGSDTSQALNTAREWLEKRGNSPRQNRNALIFVAADKARLEDLKEAAAWKLAWAGIFNERESLNLDPFNTKMAEKRLEESVTTLRSRLPEAFQWILIPAQPSPLEKIDWDCRRLGGSGGIVERAWNKLKREGQIADQIAGTILRHDLDRYLWQDQPHISVKQLSEYYSQYPYLQRLTCPEVVLEAIRDGVNHVAWDPETFAYADRYDDQANRYIGLKSQTILTHIATDGNAVLIKPEVAIQQIQADQAEDTTGTGEETDNTDTGGGGTDDTGTGGNDGGTEETEETASTLTRYYGVIDLEDATRVNRDVATISNEIIQHLTSILGANVEVSLEINANIPGGLTEQQIRILSENSRTLRFRDHGFE
jgi:predicted AAA+ superfamily ATPase